MVTSHPVVFAAVHMGPYQTLAPLDACVGVAPLYAVDGIARRHRAERGEIFVDRTAIEAEGGSVAFLRRIGARVLVRSTSDDVEGENLEDMLAQAAAELGLPVVVVEDFPGNFQGFPFGARDVLCVDGDTIAAQHAARGVPPDQVHVTGNPRHDALRRVDVPARRRALRDALGLGDEAVALWVGQPDPESSYATLEALLPAFEAAQTTLLFRAHPRDEGYVAGRYDSLLARVHVTTHDVTRHHDVTGLCCAADLVVTQFSSVAVEGAYLGTPALFAVLPGLGGAYIRKRKGYGIPPWCEDKCAFLLDDAKMAPVVVDGAMHDPAARDMVRVNFARRYTARPPSTAAVARLITTARER